MNQTEEQQMWIQLLYQVYHDLWRIIESTRLGVMHNSIWCTVSRWVERFGVGEADPAPFKVGGESGRYQSDTNLHDNLRLPQTRIETCHTMCISSVYDLFLFLLASDMRVR